MNNYERDDKRIGVDDFIAFFGDDKAEAIKQLCKIVSDKPPRVRKLGNACASMLANFLDAPPKLQRDGTLAQEVKIRLDIVDVISDYVSLERSGRNFKTACPFCLSHYFMAGCPLYFYDEQTPSFFVFPDRQTWRCFGACADEGDALAFIMKAEGIGFSEALEMLRNAILSHKEERG